MCVDGTRDTVYDLDVELWESVLGVDGSIRDVTDGSSLYDVSDGESLDGLVLGNSSRAVGASHKGDVASAVLVSTAVLGRESKWIEDDDEFRGTRMMI